jgi:hypothetical protein
MAGPLWHRPGGSSLLEVNQIMGHTYFPKPEICTSSENITYIYLDCSGTYYMELDQDSNYIIKCNYLLTHLKQTKI